MKTSHPISTIRNKNVSLDDDYDISYDKQNPKSWKQSGLVPLGLFGAAVVMVSLIVMKGRGSGKGLGQRIMEARVMSQATAVSIIIGTGLYLKSTGKDKSHKQ